jgi:hypothetical protein
MKVLPGVVAIEVVGAVLVTLGALLFAGDSTKGWGIALFVAGGLLMGPVVVAYLLARVPKGRDASHSGDARPIA